MSNTIQGAAITPETPLQASVAQGPVIINDYVIDLQEVPEGVQLTVRKGSEEQTAVIPMGGSGGGVTSWNDLQDRPFGARNIVYFENANVTFAEGQPYPFSVAEIPMPGTTMTAVYDGVTYECPAYEFFGGAVVAGDMGLMSGEPSGTYPFVVIIGPGEDGALMGMVMGADVSASHTMSLNGQAITKIPHLWYDMITMYHIEQNAANLPLLFHDAMQGNPVTRAELEQAVARGPIWLSWKGGESYHIVVAANTITSNYGSVKYFDEQGQFCGAVTVEYTPESTASE